jgi:EAL domain-containing protein (putative c-di-GMP-specific phosphodiesterase class I)/GGDEF domain-containing protein
MSSDSLIRALPDLVVGVRKDGVILAVNGGHAVVELKLPPGSIGQNVDALWPVPRANLIKQLTRKAIASRSTTEARFQEGERNYEMRASAQGPDRAVCVIRPLEATSQPDAADATAERLAPQFDRRGFLRRFKESVSMAALREKPLSVAVLQLEGVTDIAQALTPKLSEQVLTTAILRLSEPVPNTTDGATASKRTPAPHWYLGQLSDNTLALVIESSDREAIEAQVARTCDSLKQPVEIAGDFFQMSPSAGVAILGQDSATSRGLLDNARAAAIESRRNGGAKIYFCTDTLSLKTLSRIDVARELHEAIANREIQLRYLGRHDLATGRLVAWVGYLRWAHPLRGEIRALDFLRIAETTGLGTTLSRAMLGWLQEDYKTLTANTPDVRISFGALRHHLSHEKFIEDIEQFVANGIIPPEHLELRISEDNLGVRQPNDFKSLAAAGIHLIVDKVGRGSAPWDWLARAPIQALKLDRAWVVACRKDPVALKVCRAAIATARALGLTPIAPGIDDKQQLATLSKLGCQQGSGDYYKDDPPV